MLLYLLKFSITVLNINNYKYWVSVNINITNNNTCEVRFTHSKLFSFKPLLVLCLILHEAPLPSLCLDHTNSFLWRATLMSPPLSRPRTFAHALSSFRTSLLYLTYPISLLHLNNCYPHLFLNPVVTLSVTDTPNCTVGD